MKTRHEFSRKPVKCPECGSNKIADILRGMPAYSKKLQRDMDSGRIVLGGCCVTGDDPRWQCAECHAEFYKIKAKRKER